MQLTMTGEYAVRAMLHLASQPAGSVLSIKEISIQDDIPETFLRKIIAQLSKSGLVISQRGSGGGIVLAKPTASISLLDVIEAAEGKIALNKCMIGPEVCGRSRTCSVHLVWREVQMKLREMLRSKSLEYLVRHGEMLASSSAVSVQINSSHQIS